MAEVVTMPKLGFDMAEGTLARWVIQEGEPVIKGSILAEIETDKATVEVESAYEGVVAQHLVATGEVVPVNTPIAVIAAPGEKAEIREIAEYSQPKEPASEEEVPPESTPLSAPEAQPSSAPTPQPPSAPAPPEERLPGGVRASPLARRMARDMHINLQQIQGSGPGGRVLIRDIKAYIEAPSKAVAQLSTPLSPVSAEYSQPTVPPSTLPPAAPLPITPPPPSESMPINRLRAAIGRRMTEAKQQVPHFYVTYDYDVAALVTLRKQVNALLSEEEKASINDFIIKAVALTLRQFPNLNASLQGDQIVHHGPINIGVAVAVEGGLLTVVCRDADRKPVCQIASEVRVMAARARAGKVRPEDIEGSTFSVSNLGMFDVEHFIAIINPPEAAILALGSAKEVPFVEDGQVKPGWRMKATISVDHRVSDGAEAARFLQALAQYLEEPLRLFV